MEWKIGEIKQVNGEWYQCVEGNGCENCAFKGRKCYLEGGTDDPIGECCYDRRRDNKDVIFKKLEKVGEPIIVIGRTFQKFTNSDSCVGCVFCNENNGCDKCCYMDEPCLDNEIWIEIKQNKEDMEEKKLNLKPFDIQKAREGKPVCTRDGRKARIICFDRVTNSTNEYTGHLIVLVTNPNGDEQSFYYTEKGNLAGEDEYDNHKWDLMMLLEKKEGWVNVYDADTTFRFVEGMVYNTKDEAIQRAKEEVTNGQREKNEYVDTVKICWEE